MSEPTRNLRASCLLSLLVLATAPMTACEMTFAHEANVDYGRYRTARLAPITVSSSYAEATAIVDDLYPAQLWDLRQRSGFETVFAWDEVATDEPDLTIEIALSLALRFDVEYDAADCDCASEMVAEADGVMTLRDSAGAVAYRERGLDAQETVHRCPCLGSAEDSFDADEKRDAAFDALDEALDDAGSFLLASFEI